MNLFDLIDKRRSIRQFQDKEIPSNIIDKIKQCAYKIPSAGALYPLELYYIKYNTPPSFFIICANFAKTTKKYGDRGKHYVYMEAGHMAQNICLACVEFELGSCCIGAFDEDKIQENCKLEYKPIYLVAVGYPK